MLDKLTRQNYKIITWPHFIQRLSSSVLLLLTPLCSSLSLCRSSSTSGESWWMRSRQPRTLGSARLWAPWRALPPRPPAPHPRLRPLQRKVPPRQPAAPIPLPPSFPLAGCTLELRNTSWSNKQQRNAVFLFQPVAKWSPPVSLTANSWKDEGRNRRGPGPASSRSLNVYVWVNLKASVDLLCFTGNDTGEHELSVKFEVDLKGQGSLPTLFCWVG